MGKNYCAIKDCHNTKGMIGRFGIQVKLHHLQSDKDLRAAWLRAISRKDFTPSSYTQVKFGKNVRKQNVFLKCNAKQQAL